MGVCPPSSKAYLGPKFKSNVPRPLGRHSCHVAARHTPRAACRAATDAVGRLIGPRSPSKPFPTRERAAAEPSDRVYLYLYLYLYLWVRASLH